MASVARPAVAPSNATFKDKEKPQEVRKANILAARAVSDAIRTSLGPKGMDKMIRTKNGEIIISNDGATILKHMASCPDVEAGDGTTTVAILTGAFLGAAERLLSKGIHPTLIAESFQRAAQRSVEILLDMSYKISLDNREQLIRAATTSLSSKIVSQHSQLLAPLAVDSVLKVINEEEISSGPDETIMKKNVDLNDIRLIKKVGGTIDDTHLVNGMY
ncbi:TCP-1/cpn60 chaperonin family protein [Candida albicans]|uniref:TCP-1/cpn60 chaperonin family protein n=1 Tax=Candida albicans TaxID=5476 RepID=A0A8H6BVE4_CANAX|nr:TCP-1/cpn60 chaperonin family protein [Candida albicans]